MCTAASNQPWHCCRDNKGNNRKGKKMYKLINSAGTAIHSAQSTDECLEWIESRRYIISDTRWIKGDMFVHCIKMGRTADFELRWTA